MAELETAAGGALSEGGTGRLVLVTGPAGIGKTALVTEAAACARDAGARVAWGRCGTAAGAAPFRAWTQILRALAVDAPVPPLEPGASGPALDPGAVFQPVWTFLERAALRTPIALVLDDLHRADDATLALLELLAAELSRARILVLATYRRCEAESRGAGPRIARIAGHGTHIRLPRLGEDDVQALATAVAGRAPGIHTVAAMHAITEGTPLLVQEIARALTALPEPGPRDAHGPIDLRAGVAELMATGLGALSTATRDLLAAAAVVLLDERNGAVPDQRARHRLRREGDVWVVAFGDRRFHVRDGKGMGYLAYLLANPGRRVHVLELATAARLPDAGAREGIGAGGLAHGLDVSDRQAVVAYRQRLQTLRAELERAETWHDATRATRLREEIDFLETELARAVGLRGRRRRTASMVERARLNVTRAIRAAEQRLAGHDDALGTHLARTVHTGTYCAYEPGPESTIVWEL